MAASLLTIKEKGQPDKMFRLAVLAVVDTYESGTPKTLRLIREDETVDVREFPKFITAYIPEVNFKDL